MPPILRRLGALRLPPWTPLLLLTLLISLFWGTMEVSGDTLWALRAGQDLWHGHPPLQESWTSTRAGAPWPNHALLWQGTLYLFYRVGASSLLLPLLLGACLLAAALALPLLPQGWESARRTFWGAGEEYLLREVLPWGAPLLIGAFLALPGRLELRPTLCTSLALALLLSLLLRERYRLIPLLFLPWASAHAGVLYGALVLLVACGGCLLGGVLRRSSPLLRRGRTLLVTGVLSFLATLLNPLGWGLWQYVFASWRKVGATVGEFTPTYEVPIALLGFLVATGASLLLLAGWRRRWRATPPPGGSWPLLLFILLLLPFALLALLAVRNLPLFLGLVSLLLLEGSRPLLSPSEGSPSPLPEASPRRSTPLDPLKKGLMLAGLGVLLLPGAAYGRGQLPAWPEEYNRVYDACAATGPTWNDYSSGGRLLWYHQSARVFQDSRWDYFDDEMKEYWRLGAPGWEEFLHRRGITCAFVLKVEEESWRALEDSPAWEKVFDGPEVATYRRVG